MLRDTALSISQIITSIIVLLLLPPACERDLNLNDYYNPKIEKMLVVNSILNPDSLIKVSVTHPYFFSTPHLEFKTVSGLDINISDNEGKREILTLDERSGVYIANRYPSQGETIYLYINSDSDSVKTSDTLPLKVEIDNIEISGHGPTQNGDYNYCFTYKISFQDTPDIDNYYFLKVEEGWGNGKFTETLGGLSYSDEYVFQVLAAMLNQHTQGWKANGLASLSGFPFSDKGIDGKNHTITLTEKVYHNPAGDFRTALERKISLYSISKPYFDYMLSILSLDYDEEFLKGNLLSLGLMEPTRIYSNIQGGAGIMGSYIQTIAIIDLLKFTGGWP